MVWHAHQLNPRNYLEDCLRYGKMQFWRTGLPWAAIDSCINNITFEFQVGADARQNFESGTGCSWHSLDDELRGRLDCPLCSKRHTFLWTGWNTKAAWKYQKQNGKRFRGEDSARGFADKNLHVKCQCGLIIDHNLQKIKKFREDIYALRDRDIPMPGTLLSQDGKWIATQSPLNHSFTNHSRYP